MPKRTPFSAPAPEPDPSKKKKASKANSLPAANPSKDVSRKSKVPPHEPGPSPQPRARKKPHHPFRRKSKVPPPAVQLSIAEKLLTDSRARAQVTVLPGKYTPAMFTDALFAEIPMEEGLKILRAQLEATTTIFDLNANQLVTKPDGPTRQKALELWTYMGIGKPVERKIIEHHNLDSPEELQKKLRASPALCDSILEMVLAAKAEREQK